MLQVSFSSIMCSILWYLGFFSKGLIAFAARMKRGGGNYGDVPFVDERHL